MDIKSKDCRIVKNVIIDVINARMETPLNVQHAM